MLQGYQGKGKTSWFKSLLPKKLGEYVLDGIHLDVADKDSIKRAVSSWIVELGELDSTFKKSDTSRLKAFLSLTKDSLRLPYDRLFSNFNRKTSFCASVNEEKFLIDTTGNRRMGPIKALDVNHTHGLEMQQVWAEVWDLYISGEQWWPDAELIELIESRHDHHQMIDNIEDAMRSKFNLDIKPNAGLVMNCTDIVEYCSLQNTKANINRVADVLSKLEFDKPKSGGKRGYRLCRLNTQY